MENFFLQVEASNDVQDSIAGGISSFVENVNPFELPHTTFVTDLAIIMILAAFSWVTAHSFGPWAGY